MLSISLEKSVLVVNMLYVHVLLKLKKNFFVTTEPPDSICPTLHEIKKNKQKKQIKQN